MKKWFAGMLALLIAMLGMASAEQTASASADAEYRRALELLDAGVLPQAQSAFLDLGDYEDSVRYYFYVSARLYEQEGNLPAALAIYSLMPQFRDCAERIERVAAPETAPEPAQEVELMTFHEFIDSMPLIFDDRSKTEQYYSFTYTIKDDADIRRYADLFRAAGWELIEQEDSQTWQIIYFINNNAAQDYFYIMFSLEQGTAIIVFDSTADYGFDVLGGL